MVLLVKSVCGFDDSGWRVLPPDFATGMKSTRLKFCFDIMAFAKNHSILCRCLPRNRIALSKMEQSDAESVDFSANL